MENDQATPPTPAIARKLLLTAVLAEQTSIDRVEVREINLAPQQKTGLHFHPCSVVGYVVEGAIWFQVEGQSARKLNAGDAFFEPAHTRIVHFDNVTEHPTKFIAYYLLGKNEHELITML